ncbi:hypothetical protein AMYX_11470 [Anaeromyxobacter diazotrophicus]|uniref:Porin n=2 Tax=Anaeromyxobacter diazotrophicus TaxID=2590199 RepID=A0A7I9VJ11_9BACT|nr:hypothetical protein AMYX_11470 [Anaeromyxobacter diazotrophicus]
MMVAPAIGSAQTAEPQPSVPAPVPAAPSEAQPAPSAVPAAKPAPAKVTITPYGFILLQSFWNDGPFSAKDYPGQVLQNHDGGAFLMSARGSRFGFKVALPDDPFTGAQLSGVIEGDFKGGFANNTTTSANWYNSMFRLRLAYMTASWGDASNKFSFVIGQDWKIVAPLAPTSIAFGYDQMFTQAGNLNNRDQQIKAIYDMVSGGVGLNVSAAMLGPQDTAAITGTGTPVVGVTTADYGAGNRSRMPNFEGRLAVNMRDGKKKVAEVGVAGAVGWRRYDNVNTPNTTVDTTTKLGAVDAVFNFPFITLQGEGYVSDGMEDSYTSLLSSAVIVNSTGAGAAAHASSAVNIQSQGYWAQAILKPLDSVQIPVGYGMAQVRYHGAAAAVGTRFRNAQFHTGLLFNMTNPWKFGFEFTRTTSGYNNNQGPATANQYVLASKLDF